MNPKAEDAAYSPWSLCPSHPSHILKPSWPHVPMPCGPLGGHQHSRATDWAPGEGSVPSWSRESQGAWGWAHWGLCSGIRFSFSGKMCPLVIKARRHSALAVSEWQPETRCRSGWWGSHWGLPRWFSGRHAHPSGQAAPAWAPCRRGPDIRWVLLGALGLGPWAGMLPSSYLEGT